jgi:hypothetical protein
MSREEEDYDDDYDDDKFFDAATFKEESVEKMLADSSDNDEEELLQFILLSAASARHTVELMMDIFKDDKSNDSEREWGTGLGPEKAKNKARNFKGAYQRLFKKKFSMDPPSVYNKTNFEQ